MAVVGFVTALMIGFGCAESTAAEVTSSIMAGATLIAYIIGEGMVDASVRSDAEETHVVGLVDSDTSEE